MRDVDVKVAHMRHVCMIPRICTSLTGAAMHNSLTAVPEQLKAGCGAVAGASAAAIGSQSQTPGKAHRVARYATFLKGAEKGHFSLF